MLNIKKLKEGDIIKHVLTGNAYIVIQKDKDKAIAVRTVTVINETEWIKIDKE